MPTPRKPSGSDPRKSRKATTPEARESQLTNLAFNLAEDQLRNGTASAMVITHFLKLQTVETKLKEEKLRKENNLLESRQKSEESSRNAETFYSEVLKAIKTYQGHGDDYEDL